MDNGLSIFENMAYSTIRIECDTKSGLSTGTGFFYRFFNSGDRYVPAIITNKHVVEGSINGHLYFTLSTTDGKPNVGKSYLWNVGEFEKAWIPHPDPEIDLCAMPITTLVDVAFAQGHKFFITFFEDSVLPSEADIDDFAGMERIVMVGYPNGIWDRKNNFPVFRSGVVATHYRYDWNGKPEFLIDCACFPGSSGSPIVICDVGHVLTKKGWNLGTNRVKFLGVLYAGPQHRVDGHVEIVPVPTSDRVVSVSNIPNNLGMVIKSRKILDFENELKSRM